MAFGFVTQFFGGKSWSLDGIEPPWGSHPAIYEHVKAHIRQGQPGLMEGGDTLPDEDALFNEGDLRWVSGGLDGAFGHHGGGGDAQETAKEVFRLLKETLRKSTDGSVGELYAALKAGSTIDYVDPLLQLIVNDGGIDAQRLHALSIWLATKSADREPVKMALALLGILLDFDDSEVILTLARHEEFTLYATVAVTHNEEATDRMLWEIAKNVDGWGRIQVVERLARTDDPEIKAWLLRDGYKNSVLYEYLAYTCATAGDLRGALANEAIDDTLLLGAGELIESLIIGQGGPAEGIDDYEHGAEVTQAYLKHVADRANTLDQFLALNTIGEFLTEEEADWNERAKRGWNTEARKEMTARISLLLAQEKWRRLAETGLQSTDNREFSVAVETAEALGIDTWPEYYARTRAGEDHWFKLMESEDPSRIEKAVALAEAQLPLSKIATGPDTEMGLGPGFGFHIRLDVVLEKLDRFPGLGWDLIQTGLKSPLIRNRDMSIRALSEWKSENWPPGAREFIEQCHVHEPVEDVKTALANLLEGRPIGF